MAETIWLLRNAREAEDEVRMGFASYWDVSGLAQSPLAHCRLVKGGLLEGDESYPEARGYALRATLDWGLKKLGAKGTSRALQSVEVLQKRYIEGMSNTEYADLRGLLNDSTAQARRKSAIGKITKILRAEAKSPTELEQRKQGMIGLRYGDCSANEQEVLRFLAIFRESVPVSIADVVEHITLQPHLSRLLGVNLLISDDEVAQIGVHPEIRAYLLTCLSSDERGRWHRATGAFYEEQGNLIEAVYHLQRAGQIEAAAGLLIGQEQLIGDQLPIVPLQERLADFQRAALSAKMWVQLKILAGRTAELANQLNVAQREYEQALGAEDDTIKAEAYYRLARVYEQRDLDAALLHYAACQKVLTNVKEPQGRELFAKAYISEAWIFIEQRPDLNAAAGNLRKAERILAGYEGQEWSPLRSDIHNAWSTFYEHKNDPKLSLEHGWRAWQYAREAQDVVRSINTAHNLGVSYFGQAQYDEARTYFEESQKLALQAGNKRMAALSSKGIGSCYVSGSSEHEKAIPYYRNAHNYFNKNGNEFWQSVVCYDLAEAHAQLGNTKQAKQYFDEGIRITEALGNQHLRDALEELGQSYIELSADLPPRQLQAVGFIRKNGTINRQEHIALTQVSKVTASRDLNSLVKKGICVKEGRARATCYKMAT